MNVYNLMGSIMKNISSVLCKALSFVLMIATVLQFMPLTSFAATEPLRPQLLGGNLDAGDDNVLSIYVFGDAVLSTNNILDITKNFAAKDGIRLDIAASTYNNEGTEKSTYNLWELFEWSAYASGSSVRPTASAKIVGPRGSKLQSFFAALKNAENPVDHVILLAGRDYSLYAFPDIEKTCVKWFDEQLKTYAPDAEINFFSPPDFSTDYPTESKSALLGSSKKNIARNIHNREIRAHALAMKNAVTSVDASVYQIGSAWESFINNEDLNKGSNINLYCSDGRNPSLEGSYYNACLLYLMLTGNSPVGMDVYGQLNAEDAKLLQRAAHIVVKGEEPQNTTHDDSNALTLDTLTKPATSDSRLIEPASEYNKNFNALMATAMAYVQRGSWLQYDQTSFTAALGLKSLYRRVITADLMAPEQATPQNLYYTDCSAWTAAVYDEVFGFKLKNADGSEATSTRHLVRYRDTNKVGIYTNLCVYSWGDGTAVTDAEKTSAMNDIHSVVQPGDILVYCNVKYETNAAKQEGHAVLYVGNGYIVHCSGASQAAMGGADYNVNAQHDKYELNGGMVIEPLEAFTSPDGYRNMFKKENEVVVLRPFATGKCNTPTSQAQARLNGLVNIVAYKESSVSLGQTASKGQEVTFTYHVKNLNSTSKTVNIVESLPSSLTYVSGDGKYDSSSRKVTISGSVAAGKEKTFKLTVKVASNASGTIGLLDTATINGVYLNSSPIVVGKTMSNKEQAAVSYLLSEMTDYNDGYALAKALYSKLDCSLPFSSANDALKSVLEYHPTSSGGSSSTSSYSKHYVLTYSNTQGIDMLAPHLFGGQYVLCNKPYKCCNLHVKNREERFSGDYMRARTLLECYFISGDMLLYAEDPASDAAVYIYGGDGVFYSADSNGVKTVSGSQMAHFLEGMMGKAAFCVLRPSLSLNYSADGINVPVTPDEPTHEHSWGEGSITKSATCKEEGERTFTCSCGETKTETVAKLTSHTWDGGKVTKNATCKEEGVRTFTCSICSELKTETFAKLTEHSWDSGKIEGDTKTFTCTVCGATKTEKVDTPVTPDTPDEPTEPDIPDEPVKPDTPDTPTEPDAPAKPDTPAEPDTPDEAPSDKSDTTTAAEPFPVWIIIVGAVAVIALIVVIITKKRKS